jgi:alkanesulfonate monooxygenase SsuD/methylene tetrahydromethanopterin reductase-like flavin-dependent oxidoreductase (luciferase family)
MSIRYAVGLPNVGGFGDPRLLVEFAVLAEESGWDGVYLWDHVLFHDSAWPVANPTVTAGAIAAATTRIRLIVMHVLPRRRVQLVARESVTLDVLSGGRLTLAAAIGSMDLEYAGFGEPPSLPARGAALDAALADLCALWSGEPVVVSRGSEPVRMTPAPVQRPRIPIWCGGRWPNRAPLRRAAHYDGAMPTFANQRDRVLAPSEFAAATSYIAAQRGGGLDGFDTALDEPRGRDALDGFDIALEGASPPGGAAAAAAPYVGSGLTWWVEALGWWRTPDPADSIAHARARITASP